MGFAAAPVQYEGSISDFVHRHVVPTMPPPAALASWCEALLTYYEASLNPICIVRGKPRGCVQLVPDGSRPLRMVYSDNSPGIWAYTHCMAADVDATDLRWRLDRGRLPVFFALDVDERPGQDYGVVLPAREREIWQQGWKLCHMLAVKPKSRRAKSSPRALSLRNLCPANQFLWPKPRAYEMQRLDWSEAGNVADLGESARVIAWVQNAVYERFDEEGREVYQRFLDAVGGALPEQTEDGGIRMVRREEAGPDPQRRTRKAPRRSPSSPGPAGALRVGAMHTRDQIHDIVGGGSKQAFLPSLDGVVLCACLTPDLNPDAPDVILPGTGPGIEAAAELLRKQKGAIPAFLKRGPGAWEYVGRYSVESRRWTAKAIAFHERRTGRTDITSVIWMERTGD